MLFLTSLSFASEVCKTDSDEMLSQLLLKHPSVKMSQEAIKGAKYKVDSAFWNYFPTPSVDFSARDEGRNEGISYEKIKFAKKMLEKKMDIALIMEMTGLTKEEIEKL